MSAGKKDSVMLGELSGGKLCVRTDLFVWLDGVKVVESKLTDGVERTEALSSNLVGSGRELLLLRGCNRMIFESREVLSKVLRV